jgi:hypothetical protein
MAPGLTATDLILLRQLAEKELANFNRLQAVLLQRTDQEEIQMEYVMAKANIIILQRLVEKLELLNLAL